MLYASHALDGIKYRTPQQVSEFSSIWTSQPVGTLRTFPVWSTVPCSDSDSAVAAIGANANFDLKETPVLHLS